MTYQLIGVGNNAKTIKGDGEEYLTAIKYMQPYKTMFKGKVHNLCAMADMAGCAEPCLRWAGRGQMSSVQRGRERKTLWYLSDRVGFMDALVNDITVFRRRCIKNAVQPCVRPNGTSDIMYEKSSIMDQFPDVQFYDYTKKARRFHGQRQPDNYRLMLLYSGAKHYQSQGQSFLKSYSDAPMAVVFRNKNFPWTFMGREVINGDNSDWVNVNHRGVVVGLVAKGPAKTNTNGFVVENDVITTLNF